MQVFVRAKIRPDPCKRGLSVQVWDLRKEGQYTVNMAVNIIYIPTLLYIPRF